MGFFSDDEPSGVMSPKKTRQVIKERTGSSGEGGFNFWGLIRSKTLLFVILALIIGVNLYYIYFKPGDESAGQTNATIETAGNQTLAAQPGNQTLAADPEPKYVPLYFTPNELFENYLFKFGQAEQRFTGNRVKITGTYAQRETKEHGPFIMITDPREGQIQCYLNSNPEYQKYFDDQTVGRTITVQGICRGPVASGSPLIVFEECVVTNK